MNVKLPNFTRNELLQSGGKVFALPQELEFNLNKLAICLQALRFSWGRPIIVTSGYRSEEHNQKIGGVPNSLHCQALAVDCYSEPFTAFWSHCDRFWPGGAILYATHLHLDLGRFYRGKK